VEWRDSGIAVMYLYVENRQLILPTQRLTAVDCGRLQTTVDMVDRSKA
jgi:hypothetical protein